MRKKNEYVMRKQQLALAGYSNPAAVRMLRWEFPGSKPTEASMATTRYILRKEGHDVFTSRNAPKQRADYSHLNSLAPAALPPIPSRSMRSWASRIVELMIEAINAGFDTEDAAAWVWLNV